MAKAEAGAPDDIVTARLRLVALDLSLVEDQLASPPRFFSRLGVRRPVSWPPPLNDAQSWTWFRDRLVEEPWASRWMLRLAVQRANADPVGVAGFKGPPREDGVVELGYSILPRRQRRGFASEAVEGLTRWAFADPRVRLVIAHTLQTPALEGSRRTLMRCGFRGPFPTAEEGVIRYERALD